MITLTLKAFILQDEKKNSHINFHSLNDRSYWNLLSYTFAAVSPKRKDSFLGKAL